MSAPGAQQQWTPERSVAGNRNPWSIVGVISIATFMVVLDSSIANVALAHIAGSLSASYDQATWVVTSFLVANAVIIPVSGWIADVIGRKRYYMISVALFTVASFVCGISSSLGMLVVARIVQGIGGGGLTPVEQSMLVDTFPPEKRGAAFAAYGIVVIVGPIFGPTLGGWITDNLSWGWVFLINVPIGILSLILVSMFVDEPEALRRRSREIRAGRLKIDFIGFVLVALALGALEVTLDRGQRNDWFSSPVICITTALAAISFLILIPWELSRDDPIVRIRMYFRRNFGIANLFMLLMGVIVFGTTQFIPQFLQEVMGYTATDAGLALTLGGLATLLVMPVSGILTGRVDPRILIGIAFVLQAIAMWNLSHFNTQITFQDAAVARLIQSVGLPFLFVPVSNAAYIGLRPDESNQASALLNVSRNLGGTFGISLVQTMLAQRAQVHQAQYVETLNPLNPNYVHGIAHITQTLIAHGAAQAEAAKMASALLYRQLLQQAAMLSYIDVFHTLMIIVLCALPLVFLMQGPGKQKPGAAAAAVP
ncbi:MAG TPA: DHA2 family efflux MFS transporter permease subunit [Rhizomicrobium sp.]|jgi:DHA2 family multidrug resistance protein|nr:DHA2 family efflux MFS transporter permease subunit [Rhizomicrobium sp.]